MLLRNSQAVIGMYLGLSLSSACATRIRPNGPNKGLAATSATKQLPKKAPAPPAEPAVSVPNLQAANLALWNRLSNPQLPMSEADYQSAATMAPGEPASLEEAIVTMACIRSSLQNATKQSSVLGSDELYGKTHGTDSLEINSKTRKLVLAENIARNPLLRSFEVLRLTQLALATGANSAAFTQSVSAVISQEIAKWQGLTPKEGEKVAESQPEAPPAPEPLATAEVNVVTGPSPGPSPEVERLRHEAIIAEMQRLADRGSYKEAIKKASGIPANDASFSLAQEKVKRISNKAVQNLRQKAAQAFQSGMPVADPSAKAAYLEQAQKYLNEALSSYPQSDQLDMVRENLATISKNLAGLTKSKADKSPDREREL